MENTIMREKKENKSGKYFKFLIFGILFIIALLVICFKFIVKDDDKPTIDVSSINVEDKCLDIGENIYSLYVHNKNMFYVKADGTEDEKKSIYVHNLEVGEDIQMKYKLSGFSNLCDMCMDDENNYYALEYSYELPACDSIKKLSKYYETVADGKEVAVDPFSKGVNEQYDIVKLDAEGNELSRVNIFSTSSKEDEFTSYILNYINIDEDNNVYVIDSNKEIKAYDKDLKPLFSIKGKAPTYFELYRLQNGNVGVRFMDNDGSFKIAEVDSKKKDFGEIYKKFEGIAVNSIIGNDNEGNLLYVKSGVLHQYTLAKKKPQSLGIDFNKLGIKANDIKGIEQLEDGTYQIVHLDYGTTGKSDISVTSISTSSGSAQKQEIVFATFNLDSFIQKEISKFNEKNTEYKIIMKDYSQYNDEALTKFQTDALAGKIDLVDANQINWREMSAQGLFANLYDFMDGEKELNKGEFSQSYLGAYTIKDALYVISPSFTIKTLFGRVSDVGSKEGWTVEEFKNLLKSLKGNETLMYNESRTSIMPDIIDSNMSLLVDYDKCESYFSSDLFKDILNFSSSFQSEEELKKLHISDSDINGYIRKMGQGKFKLCRLSLTPIELQSLQVYEEIMGDKINLVGFPSESGEGTVFSTEHLYGVLKNSKFQKEAWNFISQKLSKDYQNEIVNEFPIRTDSLNNLLSEMSKSVIVSTDDEGKVEKEKSSEWFYGDYKTKIYPVSQDYIEKCKEVINHTVVAVNNDKDVQKIIFEETEDYFNGSKNETEVARIIQDRVQNYLNENYR